MQERFTKINDEFYDMSDIPINKNENVEKAAETELIDDTSITDRFEVYRQKLQNVEPENLNENDGVSKGCLVQTDGYKTYRIYNNSSLSSSQTQVITGLSGQFTRESIESSQNGKNPAVQNLIKDSDEQITAIHKMLEEQRKKKSFQNDVQSDGEEERRSRVYLNKKLVYIEKDQLNYSLPSQREDSLENELWTSKSANDRIGRDLSRESNNNLLEIKTALDKEKNAYNSLDRKKTEDETTRVFLSNGSQSRLSMQHGKTASSSSFKKNSRNNRDSSNSTSRDKSHSQKDKSGKSQDKLPIEERLRLQDQAREARLENLRKMRELAETAELKDRPEISKNSQAILSKSAKFKNKADLYQRCIDFQKEKELNNMTKQHEKIAEVEAQCTHQPEINLQSRHLHRQIDSLFQWNEKRMQRNQKMQQEKEQREMLDLRDMQRRTISCEGTRRILQEKSSRSNEPVERRLINQGLRLEHKLNEIRKRELKDQKTAVPKINKNSEKIAKMKGHISIYQRFANSFGAKTKANSEEAELFNFEKSEKAQENSGYFAGSIEAQHNENARKAIQEPEFGNSYREGQGMTVNDKFEGSRAQIELMQEYLLSPSQDLIPKGLKGKYSGGSKLGKISLEDSSQQKNLNASQTNYLFQGKMLQVQVMENKLRALSEVFQQESQRQAGESELKADDAKPAKKGYKAIAESRIQAAKDLKYKSQAPKLGILKEGPISVVESTTEQRKGRAGRSQEAACKDTQENNREKPTTKHFNLDLNDLISPTASSRVPTYSTKNNATQLEYSASNYSSFSKTSPQSFMSSIQMRQNKIFASGKDGKFVILDKGSNIHSPVLKDFELITSNPEETAETSKIGEFDAVSMRNLAWLNSKKAKLDALVESKLKDELAECTFKPALYSPESDWRTILKPRLKAEQDQGPAKTYTLKSEHANKPHSEKNLQILDQNNKSPVYPYGTNDSSKSMPTGNCNIIKTDTQQQLMKPKPESKENQAHPHATLIKSAFSMNTRTVDKKFSETASSNLRVVR